MNDVGSSSGKFLNDLLFDARNSSSAAILFSLILTFINLSIGHFVDSEK